MGEEARQGVRRRGRIRAVTAAALAGLVLALVPSGATAAPVLDANCPGPASGDLPPTLIGQRQAQTFTAGHTGGLTSASLAINKQTPGAFQLQVLATDSNGVPTNTVLGSAAFPNDAVPFGQATLVASFSPAIFVTAGQRYALAVTTTEALTYGLPIRAGDPCPGDVFFSSNQTGTWSLDTPAVDAIFQTFVDPAIGPGGKPIVNNKFELVSKKGRLFARVPGPGKLVVDDAPRAAKKSEATASKKRKKKRGPNFVQRTKAEAKGAGDVRLRIALTKRAIRKALSTGKLNALAGVTYTPTGGDPITLTFKIRIRL